MLMPSDSYFEIAKVILALHLPFFVNTSGAM